MKKVFSIFMVLFLVGTVGVLSAQSYGRTEASWFGIDDSADNGSSTISVSASGTTVSVTGKVTTGFKYGYIGLGYTPSPAELAALKKATGIRFKVKGDGQSYDCRLETSNVRDYNFYCKKFTATSSWTTVEIRFKGMSQKDWGMKVRNSASYYTAVSFQTIGQPINSVNFSIKDVELF